MILSTLMLNSRKNAKKDIVLAGFLFVLSAGLVALPTGYEARVDKNSQRCRARVTAVDNTDVRQFGIVKTGDQGVTLEILGGPYKGRVLKANNPLLGQMDRDKIFEEGDLALVVLSLDSDGKILLRQSPGPLQAPPGGRAHASFRGPSGRVRRMDRRQGPDVLCFRGLDDLEGPGALPAQRLQPGSGQPGSGDGAHRRGDLFCGRVYEKRDHRLFRGAPGSAHQLRHGRLLHPRVPRPRRRDAVCRNLALCRVRAPGSGADLHGGGLSGRLRRRHGPGHGRRREHGGSRRGHTGNRPPGN